MGRSAHLPESVRVVEIASDDAWMRDVGPTFVTNDQGIIRGVDWQLNTWGVGQQPSFPWSQDSLVAGKVVESEWADRYHPQLVIGKRVTFT